MTATEHKRRFGLLAVAAVGIVLAWGEGESWRVSRHDLPAPTAVAHGGVEAIVVLGFPSSHADRISAVQRYRVRIAVRSRDPAAHRSVLVFTGRSPHRARSRRSEAAVMAEYAILRWGVDPADVILEEEAESTWENIRNVIPLLGDFPVVKIASNTFHARKGRRYLHKQAPHLAAHLLPAADHRFGELTLAKPLLAVLRR